MIGILVESNHLYQNWCNYNKLDPKDFIPITSIQKVLGMKFDEVWKVKGLPIFFDNIGYVLEYFQSHNIEIIKIAEIVTVRN